MLFSHTGTFQTDRPGTDSVRLHSGGSSKDDRGAGLVSNSYFVGALLASLHQHIHLLYSLGGGDQELEALGVPVKEHRASPRWSKDGIADVQGPGCDSLKTPHAERVHATVWPV